ncbi:TPA: hypothetical protein ACTXW7_003817, partial [Legionella anisa]
GRTILHKLKIMINQYALPGNIDITLCQQCHGNVRIVACINDKTVIDKILVHIDKRDKDLKEVFNTFTIRGPPELVSLITSNTSTLF